MDDVPLLRRGLLSWRCGHKAPATMTARMAPLVESRDCPVCETAAAVAAANADAATPALHPDLAEAAERLGIEIPGSDPVDLCLMASLPPASVPVPLMGSVAQIKWAKSLRQQAFSKLGMPALRDDLDAGTVAQWLAKFTGAAMNRKRECDAVAYVAFLEGSSKWWIENRFSRNYHDFARVRAENRPKDVDASIRRRHLADALAMLLRLDIDCLLEVGDYSGGERRAYLGLGREDNWVAYTHTSNYARNVRSMTITNSVRIRKGIDRRLKDMLGELCQLGPTRINLPARPPWAEEEG